MTRWLPEKKDRRVPTTTDVFLLYHLGYNVKKMRSRILSVFEMLLMGKERRGKGGSN